MMDALHVVRLALLLIVALWLGAAVLTLGWIVAWRMIGTWK